MNEANEVEYLRMEWKEIPRNVKRVIIVFLILGGVYGIGIVILLKILVSP